MVYMIFFLINNIILILCKKTMEVLMIVISIMSVDSLADSFNKQLVQVEYKIETIVMIWGFLCVILTVLSEKIYQYKDKKSER